MSASAEYVETILPVVPGQINNDCSAMDVDEMDIDLGTDAIIDVFEEEAMNLVGLHRTHANVRPGLRVDRKVPPKNRTPIIRTALQLVDQNGSGRRYTSED